ncbi:MAG: formate acetyltransferase [bacterium]|nr:formate acetyltransferase [bacterium]
MIRPSIHSGDSGQKTPEPLALSERVRQIHETILRAAPALCAERALLVTRYFRRRTDRAEPRVVRKASALAYLLRNKKVRIYPGERLVGCFTSYRVAGGLYPELHGVAMMEDLFRFDKRAVNPIRVDPKARRRLLLEVLPYWLPRFVALRSFSPLGALAFVLDQLSPASYVVNETGGVSHFVPDYAGLVSRGTEGFRRQAASRLAELGVDSPAGPFLRSVALVCDALEAFADGYRRAAQKLASREADGVRRRELERIAEICSRVPRKGAGTFHEALQSILFAQIALNLESLDNGVSPGRLDQILGPFYQRDLAAGVLDREDAFELLGCFALKLCEIVPVFSERTTRIHGGMMNGQAVVVGGTDAEGKDASNAVTDLLLDLMDRLRTRQPNYHARLHRSSPAGYQLRIARALAGGAGSPALYNDEVIVPILRAQGMTERDARDYATVGCVEPVAAGKSFQSTDAALFNLPLFLELALNRGRRFGSWRRMGPKTPRAETCSSIDEVIELFRAQLEHGVARLLRALAAIEDGNARWHPTPLTSMLLRGCLATGRDATHGGALYNGSGIQGVGVVEVGDSLAALEAVVFQHRRASLREVVTACRQGFRDCDALRARLLRSPKFGNDDPRADRFVGRAMELFAATLEGRENRRGGPYVAGFYSMTAHQAFGSLVGALPSGRLPGTAFSSGLSAGPGCDRRGPTAALCSVASLPLHRAPNGVNFNLKLAPWSVAEPAWLQGLVRGGFAAGAMQMQINVIDPKILIEARDHPGRYPGLLVRISGYSSYFDDLSPEMKQEVIDRTLCEAVAG